MSWQFTVGLSVKGKSDRIVVHAEDALIAALKVKSERPEADIMYVRRLNRRGDTRVTRLTVSPEPAIRESSSRRAVTASERRLN
jgi:hypothetical protein